MATVDGRITGVSQQHAAFGTDLALGAEDSLRGVLDAFWAAANTFVQGRAGELADEPRGAFPAIFSGSH